MTLLPRANLRPPVRLSRRGCLFPGLYFGCCSSCCGYCRGWRYIFWGVESFFVVSSVLPPIIGERIERTGRLVRQMYYLISATNTFTVFRTSTSKRDSKIINISCSSALLLLFLFLLFFNCHSKREKKKITVQARRSRSPTTMPSGDKINNLSNPREINNISSNDRQGRGRRLSVKMDTVLWQSKY